jgi:hypothetical protein
MLFVQKKKKLLTTQTDNTSHSLNTNLHPNEFFTLPHRNLLSHKHRGV